MQPSSLFTRIGVWVLVAAFLLLPLYELADYSEVWQHDGDVIVPGLLFLFCGMALLVGRRLYRAVRLAVQMRRIQSEFATPLTISLLVVETPGFSPPRQELAFTFSDLRI